MSEKFEFKVGDVVEAFEVRGEVVDVAPSRYPNYPIIVSFKASHPDWTTPVAYVKEAFTVDGKYKDWHATPSLKFISRKEETLELAKLKIIACMYAAKFETMHKEHEFIEVFTKKLGFK